jgi:ribosomal protein S18 acetylase RimI-like enzyme
MSPPTAGAALFDVAVIRDIAEDDWHLLRVIRLRALEDSPDAFTSEHDLEASQDGRWWRERVRSEIWLLAFEDPTAAEPVGVIAATRVPTSSSADPFLSSLWVDPGHRRQGIARSLIKAAVDRMAARGARAVSLWVLDGNDAAYMFYEAVGFVFTGDCQEAQWPENVLERKLRRSLL